jgi:hypothetical protein
MPEWLAREIGLLRTLAAAVYRAAIWCDDPKQTKIQRSLASVNAL